MKFATDKKYEIYRITRPKWDKSRDIINIGYELLIFNKKNKKSKTIKEIHRMKYFDLEKIKKYLTAYKFKLLESLEIISNKKISPNTWGALIVAKKI